MTRVVVVGGGLAGMTAALAAADGGADVVLLESRPRLGGATTSFRRGDLWVDNGQHVFLRCCTAYLAFLSRIGSAGDVTIQPRLDIPVLMSGGGRARLRRSRLPLPPPLHLAATLASYTAIPLGQRARVALTALQLGRVDVSSAAADTETFGGWLGRHHQSSRAIEALWSLVTVATLNTRPDEASLALAAMVFQTGLLADASAADIGLPLVPLGQLHGEAGLRALTDSGVQVRLGARVRDVADGSSSAGRFSVVTDEETLAADAVIVAVPHDVAAELLPAAVGAALATLEVSPIVNVHVVFDRVVLHEPFAALLDGELQWVFDRTAISGQARGQYLAASISAADHVIGLRTDELRARLLPQFLSAFPEASGAAVLDFFVTREPAATFRQSAGTAAHRPGAATGTPGLFVAGAWTATGWPATMEGAVRSGTMAARAALAGAAHVATTSPRSKSQSATGTDPEGARA
ncbi:MAG: squalene-associated FAD-dependent desaturase [Frankiales bacterium]|nr:squalene-associated FAD-dependent desaturase [Frankiales bacterium]